MRRLKRYIIALFALLLLIVTSVLLLQLYVFSTTTICTDDFSSFYLDKYQHLEESSSPRMIFVGDSNLNYTLASERLAEEFPYTIINMSSKSVIGLRFDLERLRLQIKDNDVIVISGTFAQFIVDKASFNSSKHKWLWGLMVMDVNHFQYVTHPQQWWHIIDENTNQLLKRIVGNQLFSPDCVYIVGNERQTTDFNQYGDYVGHLDRPSLGRDYSNFTLLTSQLNPDTVEYLNMYAQFVDDRGGTFLFAYPAYPQGYWLNSESTVLDFHTKAQREFEFDILGQPQNYWLSNELLYDTFSHGTAEGRLQRTEQLILDLKTYFLAIGS